MHEAVHDDFVDAFVDAAERLGRSAIPTHDVTYIGPLTRPAAARRARRRRSPTPWRRAPRCRAGGVALAGRPSGWFAPTVLTDVDHDMAVMRDESFGPIIGIQRVADDDEASPS